MKIKKIHLRPAGFMGKKEAIFSFCGLYGTLFEVTEYPSHVTCKKCLAKLEKLHRNIMKSIKTFDETGL